MKFFLNFSKINQSLVYKITNIKNKRFNIYSNFLSKKEFCVNKNENLIKKEEIPDENRIGDFYKFMEENIQKQSDIFLTEKNKDYLIHSKNDNDIEELIKIIKCPITDENLEVCEEGLKIAVNIKFLTF